MARLANVLPLVSSILALIAGCGGETSLRVTLVDAEGSQLYLDALSVEILQDETVEPVTITPAAPFGLPVDFDLLFSSAREDTVEVCVNGSLAGVPRGCGCKTTTLALARTTGLAIVVSPGDALCRTSGNTTCDVEEDIEGPLEFAAVEPIFTAQCSAGVCHTGAGLGLGDLTPAALCADFVSVPASETTTMLRIAPGDPEASYLFHKMRGTHTEPAVSGTGTRMPMGAPCLSPVDLGLVRRWILDGASCP